MSENEAATIAVLDGRAGMEAPMKRGASAAAPRRPMRGEGRIFQRGNRWWIAYYAPDPNDPGRMREHRESAGKTEADAKRLLRDRRREVAVHRSGLRQFQGPRQERFLVEELLTGLERQHEILGRKGLPQLRSHLKHVRAAFGMHRAVAVTAERLRDYVAQRQKDGAANATINRELEALQRGFNLARESGTLSMAPRFPTLPEHNARQGFFERADYERVLANIEDTDVKDYLDWFFWTGMRPGEIRSLTWEAFDKETWTLRLHAKDAKTGYGRVIPLEDKLRAVIERRVKARRLDCEFIFHRAGRPVGEFRKTWATACQAAGLAVTGERDGKSVVRAVRLPYDLRRTAVRNMVRGGTDPAIAMKISGHRTRAVFDRYNIIDENDIRQAVRKTTAYVESLPTTSKIVPLHAVRGSQS
jgi:integrase